MKKIELPSMEHTFYISEKGLETGRHYDGDFTYCRPNLHLKAEIMKMTTRLNGDLKNIPLEVSIFNEMISTLSFCLVKSPEWWKECSKGRELYDMNIVQAIYQECMKFEEDWLKKVWGDEKPEETEPEKKVEEKPKRKKKNAPDKS